jgi:hypothetical protein
MSLAIEALTTVNHLQAPAGSASSRRGGIARRKVCETVLQFVVGGNHAITADNDMFGFF